MQHTPQRSLCSCAGLSLRSWKRVRSRQGRIPTCTALKGPSGGWHWPSLRRSVGRQRPHDKPLRTRCCWQLAASRWVCLDAFRMMWSPVSLVLGTVSCIANRRHCPYSHLHSFQSTREHRHADSPSRLQCHLKLLASGGCYLWQCDWCNTNLAFLKAGLLCCSTFWRGSLTLQDRHRRGRGNRNPLTN